MAHVPVLGLENGRFHIGDKTAPPTVEGLVALFQEVGVTSETLLMFSSSVDFPEEAGLSEDFNARTMVQEALGQL